MNVHARAQHHSLVQCRARPEARSVADDTSGADDAIGADDSPIADTDARLEHSVLPDGNPLSEGYMPADPRRGCYPRQWSLVRVEPRKYREKLFERLGDNYTSALGSGCTTESRIYEDDTSPRRCEERRVFGAGKKAEMARFGAIERSDTCHDCISVSLQLAGYEG